MSIRPYQKQGKGNERVVQKPQEQLSPYVASFWVFESSFGVPMTDSRIIVPDGRAKILIPYKNSLSVVIDDSPTYTKYSWLAFRIIQGQSVHLQPTPEQSASN
jgi:hypothetical protein